MSGLEVTGYVSQPYGGPWLLATDDADPFGRVIPIRPERLTEDPGIVVRCNCASIPPTLGTERDHHLSSCPFSLLDQTTTTSPVGEEGT